jgi:hypothetical protein
MTSNGCQGTTGMTGAEKLAEKFPLTI